MSLMPTAPRSIGGVLDDAIRLYRKTLSACIPIVLVGVVLSTPVGLWIALRTQSLAATGDPAAVLSLFSSPSVWLAYLAMMVVYVTIYGALIHQVDAIAHGRRASFAEAMGHGLQRLPAMLGVSILFGLAVLVGTVLLVIPGIWVWGLLQFAFVAVVLERTGVLESFGVSRRLVSGNWWRANVVIFVAMVILIVLAMVLGVVGGLIVAMAGLADAASSTGAQVVSQLVSAVLNVFTMSFYPCVLLAVFNDLKLRKEGGDLLDRVGALTPAG